MSDKNIKIRIGVEGGEQSAGQVKKVETAATGMAEAQKSVAEQNIRIVDTSKKSTDALEENKRALAEWQAQRDAERKARAGGSGLASDPAEFMNAEAEAANRVAEATRAQAEAAAAAKRAKEDAAAAARKLREEQKRLAAATRETNAAKLAQRRAVTGLSSALNTAVGRMGAVGVALRGLLNPYALLGTAVGFVVGAITKQIQKSRELEAQEVANAQAHKERVAEMVNQQRELAAARAAESRRAELNALKDEHDAIKRVNDERARTISLMQAKRRADAEIASSDDAVALAIIDADDGMSEEDKIRARALIAKNAAARDMRNKGADINDRVTGAFDQQRTAEETAAKAAKDAADTAARIENEKLEKSQLEERIREAKQAEKDIADLSARIKSERAALAETGVRRLPDSVRASVADRITEMQRQLDAARGIPQTTPDDETRVTNLGKKTEADEKALPGLQEAAKQAAKDAEEAGKNAAQALAEAAHESRALLATWRGGDVRRDVSSGAAMNRAREAAEQAAQQRREQEEAARQREAERAERDKARLDQSGFKLGERALQGVRGAGVAPAFERKVASAVAALQDGADAGEAEALANQLRQVIDAVEKSTDARESKFRELENELRRLETKVKDHTRRLQRR